jgi:predicted nucleic acid-binding protein
MALVVDTSVIIAVIGNEPQKAALVARTQGAQLFAPASLPHEIGNAFSAMLKRGRISLPQTLDALDAYRQIALTLMEVDLEAALELSARFSLYAYDAYMIACAQRLSASLLTLDGGLRSAARTAGVIVEEYDHADLS